jgi:endonuclease YncB( thermonuclease family)
MRRLAVTLLTLALMAVAAAPAAARSGSCLIPGVDARCSIWTAKVTFVGDGDTIYVDLDGDRSHREFPVRMTGINAMEQTVYSANPAQRRGQCHALEATARLEQLIRASGWRVRLAAYDPSSTSRLRLRRAVAVKVRGRWRDVGRILLSEGHVWWLANNNEWPWNAPYSAIAERAAAAHRGLWNPTYCGRGPESGAQLQVTVNGDADGVDAENVNGEWVRIHNLGTTKPVHLGGWSLQSAIPGRYVLPGWVTIPPGETLTVHVGRGIDTWTQVFLGRTSPTFRNPNRRGVGDGAFLFDPQGDLRAWSVYPCRLACADPHAGALKLAVHAHGHEWVAVDNVGATPVDLDGYRLVSQTDIYPFPVGSVLGAGERMTVDVVGDPDEDTPLRKSWGKSGSILADHGDVVRLTNLRGVQVDCFAYGSKSC